MRTELRWNEEGNVAYRLQRLFNQYSFAKVKKFWGVKILVDCLMASQNHKVNLDSLQLFQEYYYYSFRPCAEN